MPITRPILLLTGLLTGLALGAGLPAHAQNPLATVARVDDRVVTAHEVDQRARLLGLFETRGDLRREATERLIDERLQAAEARRMGIRLSAEQIAEGMAEFAGRVDLSTEEFLATIAEAGVTAESFRDFVAAGIAWREVVRQRFGGRIDITDAELARGASLTAFRMPPRVLLSEIVLPDTPDNRELAEILRDSTLAQFAEAAELYSASESGRRGGRLDWLPLENLPEAVGPALMEMQPGQILPPIEAEGAILLLQLRAIDRAPTLPASQVTVEYARAVLPEAGAEAELARLRARADSCSDFVTLLAHLPEEAVQVETTRLPELPAAVAMELARLDEREIAANQPVPGGVQAVMLCRRTPSEEVLPPREALRDLLLDRRLTDLSDGLLAELRAAAVIERR